MAKLGAWVPVKKGDHERVLITETLPFETPLIFSGDGFYVQMKENPSTNAVQRALTNVLVLRKGPKPGPVTVPFSYKIRKGVSEFRKLGVVHPSSLWEVRKFYEANDEWLIYQCSLSPLTIRAPEKVSGSFFERNDADAVNQYKKGQVISSEAAIHSRYNPSYFSYKGVTRLYKFFASERFVSLEQRYAMLKAIDTSRCFDSIYTHSIVWATMGKAVAKDSKQLATRASDFDRLMQNINHGETSGIIIGPEVSRIFAEIIFQRIDVTAMSRLQTLGLEYRRDYEVCRYVDDVFIFANSNATIQSVYECYTDAMAQYNLYSNPHKATELNRPFITQKSAVISNAKDFIELLESLIFQPLTSPRSMLRPQSNLNVDRSIEKCISSLRNICFASKANYDDVSSYILSACCERIKRFVKRKKVMTVEERGDYRDVSIVLVKLMFFLYTVAPTVNASFRFATGIILLLRFSAGRLPSLRNDIEQLVFSEICSFLHSESQKRSRSLSSFVSLEALNVLIVARELGNAYLLPPELVEKLFFSNTRANKTTSELCYFDLMTGIYYIGDNVRYAKLRSTIDSEIDDRLADLTGVDRVAEKAYLLLDTLSCPYFSAQKKRDWIVAFQQKFSIPSFSTTEITDFLTATQDRHWFIGWDRVDLLTLLQKKEVTPSY